MKIKFKNEEYYLTVTVKCGFKELLDRDMLERFNQKGIPFFLKVSNFKKKKAVFMGIRAVSLRDYLQKPISRFDFFFILAQFVRLIKCAEDNSLPLGFISYDLKNCFLTESTKELQLMFLPAKTSKTRQLPNDFIEGMIYSANPADNGDFISNFAYFHRNRTGFNYRDTESYIERTEPKVYQLLDNKTIPSGGEGNMTDREILGKRSDSGGRDSRRDEGATLLGDDGNTRYGDDGSTIYGIDNTRYSGDDDNTILGESDDTVLVDGFEGRGREPSDVYKNHRLPYLKRLSTNEVIRLTKSSFRVGTKELVADYAIKGNDTISRNHAEFKTRGSEYYVLDLSSSNKTYVNSKAIPALTEVQIYPNDVIRLSNEDFIFCV